MSYQNPRPPGALAPGRGGRAIPQALLALMAFIHELYHNQTEPLGKPANAECERELRKTAAAKLRWVEHNDPWPHNRAVAGLRRECLLTDDKGRWEDLTRQVAREFMKPGAADPPYVFDVGVLRNEASLQRHVPRAEGWRWSGWLLAPDPQGDRTLALLPSVSDVNGRLPRSVRPTAPVQGTLPPECYRTYHVIGQAGEALVAGHVANFFPEDQGALPKGRKWTAFYSDCNRQRFQATTLPLWERYARAADVAPLLAKSDADHERMVLSITGGHELGHHSGPVPLRLSGYPGFDGLSYSVHEELRADVTWLWAATFGHASRLLPDDGARRDYLRSFVADQLRYVSRGVTRRADSISALLTLNFLRARGSLRLDRELRLGLDFDRLGADVEELMVTATRLIQEGDPEAAADFRAGLNYDLANRRLIGPDPFAERLLLPGC
jgi:hypothetical protein